MNRLHTHILIPLLILAITATTLVFSGAKPAQAVFGIGDVTATIETVSIPQVFFNSIIKAIEAAGYTVLRKAMRQALKNLTKDTLNNLLEGGRGKSEAFQTEPWTDFWQQAGDEASGAALEGFVQGFQNEYEAQTKKAAAVKNFEDKETAALQPQIEKVSKLQDDVDVECMQNPSSTACADAKAARDVEEEKLKKNTDNTFAVKKRELLVKRTSLEKVANQARTAYDQCRSGDGACDTEKVALDAEEEKLKQNQDALNYELRRSNQATADELKKIDKEANVKDAALIAGNTGAVSEASKTLIDVVCKPTPDIALRIFLPLADKIEQKKRTPICPYSKLKENWSEIYNNTGTRLTEASLNGWRTIAGLVDPNTSDLGASYSVSIAGHSVSDVAKALGVTTYGGFDAAGGLKAATEYNGKITTPVTALKTVTENAITSNVQEDTRLVPTGHLLADLVITAGSTILGTAFDIFREGLKKKTAIVRQPKQNKGLAALSQFQAQSSLYYPDADPNAGSHQFAEARLARFDELVLTPAQNWDVLNKITAVGSNPLCYNPTGSIEQKAMDIESCTIDEKFNEAVSKGLTVKEAVDQGFLNGDGIFGFDIVSSSDEKTEPAFERNFPYHSLVILRKYRIIPVSWELAALYIKELNKANATNPANPLPCGDSPKKNCTLRMLMDQFNKPGERFYQMIDPNWVLMVPPTKCMLEGYGPQAIQEVETTFCDGPLTSSGDCNNVKKRVDIVRAKTCVDYQTCLEQDATGHCKENKDGGDGGAKGYGYCVQEQRIAQFTGTECKEIYAGCEVFQDPQTKQSAPYVRSSLEQVADLRNGKCTSDNAGCRWLSTGRQLQTDSSGMIALTADKKAKTRVVEPIGGVKTQAEWSDDWNDRVYLSSKAEKCQPQAEGCREVAGVPGMQYLRLPPASYECDKDGVDIYGKTVPWYKRVECKQFTGLCKKEYVGCEQYTPATDTFSLTGISPDDSVDPINPYQYRCPSQCADIKQYTVEKTLFDTANPPPVNFSAATARKCSIADVGCEEFTNVNVAAAGGEGKEYYTYLQQCQQKKPEDVPADQVFLSFIGSEQAGDQPVKYYVVGERNTDGDWVPKCADTSKPCDCVAPDADKMKYDPRIGAILCREFINNQGKSFYRYTDNLTYYTEDCAPYRRTLDGDSATNQLYSFGLSRQCTSAAAVNCREYHAPTAGNIHVVDGSYSNFEDETTEGWILATSTSSNRSIVSSNEGEILGDHSLKVFKTGATDTNALQFMIEKPLQLRGGMSYILTFSLKGQTQSSVTAGLKQGADYIVSTPQTVAISPTWKQYKFTITTAENDEPTHLAIGVQYSGGTDNNNTFFIDDIVLKETDGVEYAIKDSWEKNGTCFYPKEAAPQEPDFDRPAYLGCQLYTDRQGGQHAIQKFEKICPLEMAGCMNVKVPNPAYGPWDFEQAGGELGWKGDCAGCTAVRVTDPANAQGAGALKGVGNSSVLHFTKSTAISKGLWYRLSFDIKGVAGGNAGFYDNSGNGSHFFTPAFSVANPTVWERKEVLIFINTDFDSTKAQIFFTIDSSYPAYTVAYLDNVLVERVAYIIPDPAKQCSAQDNKCTAYGSPKLLTKTTMAEAVKTVRNLAQDSTKDEWTEKQDWNIAYYKVTPEEATVAQERFRNGDTSGYEDGICRAPVSAIDKGDLGCREYLAGGGGEKVYFRDPGTKVCQPPKEGEKKGYYYVCANDDSVVCGKDDDCPVKNDAQGKCNTQEPKYDDTKCSALPLTLSSTPQFVQKCPVNSAGCKKIIDPECTEDGKLRTDYGRVPGAAPDSGISCKREYYFTDNLRARADECEKSGGINVNAGCLLFSDESQARYEYKMLNRCGTSSTALILTGGVDGRGGCLVDSDCSGTSVTCQNVPLVVSQTDGAFSAKPPTYCACDVSAQRVDDCATPHDTTQLAPDFCYNRYIQDVSNASPLLREYKRVRADKLYDSKSLYACANAGGDGTTDLTVASTTGSTGCAVDPTKADANTLIKVKPDRSCKTWLSCDSYRYERGEPICVSRVPCKETNADGITCAKPLGATDLGTQYLGNLLKDNTTGDDKARKAPRKDLLTLSGYARPDYRFLDGKQTSGGHDLFLNRWGTQGLTPAAGLAFEKIIPFDRAALGVVKTTQITNAPYTNFCTIATSKACNDDIDCSAGEGVCGPGYLASCRLYPQQNSPRSGDSIINACQAQGGSNGIEGYCLEPYPKFSDEYAMSSPKNQTCLNDYDEPHATCSGAQGYQVYRYYENYCLNWLPIGPAINRSYIAGAAENLDVYRGQANVYYCMQATSVTRTRDSDSFPYEYEVSTPSPDHNTTPLPGQGAATLNTRNTELAELYDCGLGDTIEVRLYSPPGAQPHEKSGCDESVNKYNPGIGNPPTPLAYRDLILNSSGYFWKRQNTMNNYNRIRELPANQAEIDLNIKKPYITSIEYLMEGEIQTCYGGDCDSDWKINVDNANDGVYSHNISPYPRGDRRKVVYPSGDPSTGADISENLVYKEANVFSSTAVDVDAFDPTDPNTPCPVFADQDSEYILALWPRFNTDPDPAFMGWSYRICGSYPTASTTDTVFHIRAFYMSVKFHFGPKITPETRTMKYQYSDVYCSKYVSAVENKNVVPDMDKAIGNFNFLTSDFVPLTDGAFGASNEERGFSYALSDPTAPGKPAVLQQVPSGWTPCSNADTQHIDALKSNLNVTTATCATKPSGFNPTPSTFAYRILGSVTDLLTTTRPFAKAYHLWNIIEANGDVVGYDKQDLTLPIGSALLPFWNISNGKWDSASNTTGTGGINPPRIYGADRTEPNRFIFAPSGTNGALISFFVDIKNAQLPMKRWRIYKLINGGPAEVLGDGAGVGAGTDGVGLKEKEPPATAGGSLGKPIGPVYYTYGRSGAASAPLNNETICVEVTDNWDACTRTCGTIAQSSGYTASIPASSWKTAFCGQPY